MNTARHLLNFVEQTGQLRFSPKWESVRQLLAERGLPSDQMILFSCDHAGGLDMCVWFALPNGEIVESIMREDASGKGYTSIIEWKTVEPDIDELILARQIVTTKDTAATFAQAVQSFYDLRSFCSE